MNSKSLKIAGATLAAGSATASASIVVFDFPDFTKDTYVTDSGGLLAGNINIPSGTFVQDGSGSPSFSFEASYLWTQFRGSGVYAVSRLSEGIYLQFLSAGTSVSSASTFALNAGDSYANIPTGTFYLGLALKDADNQIHYGWFEASGDWLQTGFRLPAVTFKRFAFETTAGQSILTGQTSAVPEASTFGFVGGLFGLVAAAHLRRRKAKQAAASDKFLALAAGEKLN